MNKNLPFKKRLRMRVGDVVSWGNASKRGRSSGLRVLVYHSITDGLIEGEWEENTTPRDLFDKQMGYLAKNGYTVITAKDAFGRLKTGKALSGAVVITFDDGFRNNYINASPILEKYNFCATMFLTAGYIRDHSGNPEYLNRSEILELKKRGVFNFGCHGMTHGLLKGLNEKELDLEVSQSKKELEDIIKEKIDLFAYPFGHSASFDENVIRSLKRAHFKASFTTIHGTNQSDRDLFSLRRNRISWLDSVREFEKHLEGAYDWCARCEVLRSKKA